MTRREIKTEVERLKVLVDSIPPQARMAYEKDVLEGRILMGVVEGAEVGMRFEFFKPWAKLGVIIVCAAVSILIAVLFGKSDMQKTDPGLCFLLSILPLLLGVVLCIFPSMGERKYEDLVLQCEQVFEGLEERLTILGLPPKDLVEGQVRPRLQYLATEVVTVQRLYDCLRSDKHYGRNEVIAAGPSVLESELRLKQAIGSAGLFGFQSIASGLMDWADDHYRKSERLATPSQG